MRFTKYLCSRVAELTKKYSNLPDEYVKRSMERVYWRTPRGLPQYLRREVAKRKFVFTVDRPWTREFAMANPDGVLKPKVFVEPIKDWSFFRGDRVELLAGPDKGKQGIVVQVIQERNWVIVEGLNCTYRMVGKRRNFPGVCMKAEQPLLVTTDVALVDPADLQSTKIEWRFTESGERVRVSARTGRIIPIPALAEETYDYKTKATYRESIKDTRAAEISKITFEPNLRTFEMDIMENMGIKEDRIPAKTYWY
ncbi:hypothetical protein PR048_026099 [Dryococelus australis]|uniref:Large ribosomal subunit protein uL24m n=1 Tax=Dryococelus australis TaxID=614101 RepID=A0ABQ9GKD7_9NEOP|nr:hypothetical protein PR048_026099 [Dryococelus australis]